MGAIGIAQLGALGPLAGLRALAGPAWEREGQDWPNREASRFVSAAGLRWHVQVLGNGPVILLVHGTGASTHSWRGLIPRLAGRFTVVAPDLPGHGFSQAASGRAMSLPGMAGSLGELLRVLGKRPALAVGHSAGAAVVCRMSLDGEIAPRKLVSLNGALLSFGGVVGPVFSTLARLLVLNPFVPWLAALRAFDPSAVDGLLRDTGSRIDPEGLDLYRRLARSPRHVGATLRMMAGWDLRPLERDLRRLEPPLVLVVGGKDRFIPPAVASRVLTEVPDAEIVLLPDLGHLAHEERPAAIAELLTRLAAPSEIVR